MRSERAYKFLILFAVFMLAAGSCHAADSLAAPLRFGVFPYKDPKTMLVLFAPIARRLEEKLGRKIQVVSAPNIALYRERSIKHSYDLLWPCNSGFIEIQDKGGYKAIARGWPDFHAVIIVPTDSQIKKLEDLQGKVIATMNKQQACSYLYLFSKDSLEQVGMQPYQDFTYRFLDNQKQIISAVNSGDCDAGTVRTDMLDSSEFADSRKQLRILSTSPPAPQFPFVVRDNMETELVQQILTVLTSIGTEGDTAGRAILEDLGYEAIIPADNSDYEYFRKAAHRPE